MGFASMLEDIIEKLGGRYPMAIVREVGQEQRPTVQDPVTRYQALESAHLQAAYQREFPRRFADTATPMLEREGIPSYLRQLFLGWTYDLMTRRKSMEETWQELVHYGIPLVTRHLNEGDPAAMAFLQRMGNPQTRGAGGTQSQAPRSFS